MCSGSRYAQAHSIYNVILEGFVIFIYLTPFLHYILYVQLCICVVYCVVEWLSIVFARHHFIIFHMIIFSL